MQIAGRQESTPGATGDDRDAEAGAGQSSDGVNRLDDAAPETLERVTRAAAQAASRLNERTEALRALQRRTMDRASSYVRAHPLAAVTIAIAVGVLISRLTSRR